MSQIRTLVVTATRSGGISTVIVNRVSSANLASTIHGATSKATPLDADEIPLADSAASWVLKKLTWANLKATVKTYFDTLYATAAQGALADTALQSVPTASADTLGVIKVGSGLTITAGVLSVSGSGYTLPIAQTGTLGGIQPSDDITVNATTGVATVSTGSGDGDIPRISEGSISIGGSALNLAAADGSVTTAEFGSIQTSQNGYIFTGLNGFISTGENGDIQTQLGAYIRTQTGGYIATGEDGYINTGNGGQIQTQTGGYITTGEDGYIQTSAGGSISTIGTGTINFGADGTRTVLTGTATTNRAISFPDEDGTLALTSDLSAYQTTAGTLALGGFLSITGTLAISNVSGLQTALDGKARAIEIKTADFTAVVGGRYILESGGTITVTNPTGTTQGDSYEVWIGSGSAVINGVTYSASRFSIRARYTGSAWANPSPVLSDAVSFASTTRPTSAGTGTPASTSLITRADGDARFAPISQLVESTAQIDATGTTPADVTGMTGVTLLSNTWYRLEFAGQVTTTTGASWQIEMATTQNLSRTSGTIPSINNAGNTAVGQLSFQTSQRLIIAQRSTTGTAVNNTAIALFKTGANAPTVKITFAQWTSPAGTASLLSGAVAVFTKVP